MNMPANPFQSGLLQDRRARTRSRELTDPMLVVSLHGGPLYQLKVRDLSDEGAGIVARADSNLLQRVEVGQVVKVRVVLPRNYKGPSGHYQSRVEHITQIQEGPFSGHMIIGLSFLNRIAPDQSRMRRQPEQQVSGSFNTASKRPYQQDHRDAHGDNDDFQREPQLPVVAEAEPPGPQNESVVLVADGREEGAG